MWVGVGRCGYVRVGAGRCGGELWVWVWVWV